MLVHVEFAGDASCGSFHRFCFLTFFTRCCFSTCPLLLIHSPAPAFSPTRCCTPTHRWRVKLILPLFAALPLLVAYSGGTGIALPKPLLSLLGLSSSYLELGLLYKVWGGGCGERL